MILHKKFVHFFIGILLINNHLITSNQKYTYEVSICSMFQDEAPYLKEWIEYHKLIGVQHFYLYNNLSNDNYLEILQPYIDSNDVELIDWSYTHPTNWVIIQHQAFNDALKRTCDISHWVAFLDLDEFLLPVKENNIINILQNYEKYGGIGVNWQFFGTSFVEKIPENNLLIETLLMKAPETAAGNKHIKSIVQPKYTQSPNGPHCFTYLPGYFQVSTNKEQFTGPFSPTICTDIMRINHYWTRDEYYFNTIKIPRRMRYGDSEFTINEWIRINKILLNEVKDETILRFVPNLKHNLGYKSTTNKDSKKAVLVVGVGRSGTSATAGALYHLGLNLGNNLLPGASINEKGFFEDGDIASLNEYILQQLGTAWNDTKPIEFDWNSQKASTYKNLIKEKIIKKFGNGFLFGLKDPRISLLLPLYLSVLEELGYTPKLIFVTRKIESIVASLKQMSNLNERDAFMLIEKYHNSIKKYSDGYEIFSLTYEDLLQEPKETIHKLKIFLPELDYSDTTIQQVLSFIDIKLQHNRLKKESIIF